MGSELRASECLTLEMVFLPIKLCVTAASALQNVRYCFPTWNRFTAAVGLWNMLWWYSFPTAKECSQGMTSSKSVSELVLQASHPLSRQSTQWQTAPYDTTENQTWTWACQRMTSSKSVSQIVLQASHPLSRQSSRWYKIRYYKLGTHDTAVKITDEGDAVVE